MTSKPTLPTIGMRSLLWKLIQALQFPGCTWTSLLSKKFFAFILMAACLQVNARAFSQRISLSVKDASLEVVLKEINKQSGYLFLYNSDLIRKAKSVTIRVKEAPLEEVLEACFANQPLTYELNEKTILIKQKLVAEKKAAAEPPKTVTGRVLDENGNPMAGVTISTRNEKVSATTDSEGYFSIVIPENTEVLTVSYVGYASQEVKVGSGVLSIDMKVQPKNMEEIVVAFGTTQNRRLTSSVAKISNKDFEDRPVTNISNVLAGSVPGLQTNAGNGQPGSAPDIRIRGFSSLSNSNDPLYILDGAPYEGVISNLNPDDIESVSVLKDASASALYGARAANGVIILTTKRGKPNRNNIQVRMTHGFTSRALPDYEKVGPYEYYPLMWETYRNTLTSSTVTQEQAGVLASKGIKNLLGYNPFNVPDSMIVLPNGSMNPDAQLLYPDDLSWKDALQRQGLRSDYAVSFSGGTTKNDYYASVGYLNDQGFSMGTDFKRYNGRVRVNIKPKTWFSAGINLAGNATTTNEAIENSGINENPFYIDLILGPIYPVHRHDPLTGQYHYDAFGKPMYDVGDQRPLFTGRNVVAETEYNVNRINRNSLNGNANADFSFLKHFKLSNNFGFNLNNYRYIVYDNRIVGDAVGVGRVSRTNTTSSFFNINQLLNWERSFRQHHIKALAGHEYYYNNYDYFNGAARGQIVDGSTVLDNFTTITAQGSYERDYRTEGYLSRVEYSYDDRYVLTGSYRKDGSSRFAEEKRRGSFWSAGLGWNIDRESFFKADWVDQLKFRASYGLVGNDNTSGYFPYMSLYTIGYNNGPEPGILQSQLGNRNLTWETNKSFDAAIEFAMLKNRISGVIEIFQRQSDHLLFSRNLPLTSGLLNRQENLGSMRNRGIEVQLGADVVKNKNFNWNVLLNWTKLRNEVVSLPPEFEGAIDGTKRYETGKSIYEFWLRDWYGVNPDNGSELYVANDTTLSSAFKNGKNDWVTTSTSNARYRYFGSAIPDYYGSVRNTFSYKGLSLEFLLMYQVGSTILDNDYQSIMYRGTYGRALHKDALNRWQKPGDITDVGKRVEGIVMVDNDRYLVDGSYLNMRTATLSYTLPKTMMRKLHLQSMKVYMSGENLFILSKRKGLDPTQTFTGAASYTYAPTRIITFGINASF